MTERIKQEFFLTQQDIDRLFELANGQNIPVNEVVRRALATEKFVIEQQKEGNKIITQEPQAKDL